MENEKDKFFLWGQEPKFTQNVKIPKVTFTI